MPFSLLITLLVITHLCSACVLGIIGGGVVSRYRAYVRIEAYDWLCGGTLVSHDMVLTAAHCLFGENREPISNSEIRVIKADFTSIDWYRHAKTFACDKYVVHEDYETYLDLALNPYNLALIELEESIDLTDPENEILEPCMTNFYTR